MRFSPLFAAVLAASSVVATGSAQAASFGSDNLVIYRVGTGSGALSNAATQVYLDEYTTSGSLLQSIAVNGITASGTATSEGGLTRSADGRYLDFTGYAATLGTTGVKATTSAAVKREIGQADAQGNIAVASVLDAYSGDNIRSAVSLTGSTFYSSGTGTGTSGGVRYDVGNTSTALSATTNTRQVNIFNNQLYYSSGSGTAGVYALGSGLPTSSSTATLIAASSSPYAFYFADLNAGVAGLDTLYLADDAAGIKKFSFNGTAWNASGTIAATGVRGLTGTVNGNGVQLFATSDNGSTSKLLALTDASGYNQAITGSLVTLATASANTAFRGLAATPVPEPETYALMLAGLACLGGAALRKRHQ